MKIDWKHLFNWNIDVVGGPAAVYGRDGRVAGYKVIVKYKHHGSDTLFFDVNTEHFYTMYNGPEDAAKQTYKSYVAQMNRQKARAAVRQK